MKKVFVDMGEKVGFTNCVFEKLCFTENTIFIVFSAKHSFSKVKMVCWKNRKFMKNSGLFLNMAKWCFFGFAFFEVLVLLWFLFGVFGIVPGVLKMLVFFFPVFWAFVGWLILAYFRFGRFRCFCVSCVCFSFLCCFCFCFVCFVFVLLLDCFWCCFLFCFCFFLFLFFLYLFFFVSFFFGGFKGQVRWPKGPPHLALNPPYFLVFVFCCCFCFVFLGGLKGQVRWPKGPPHLALNPPYFLFVFLVLVFLLLSFLCFFNRQKTCFLP